jgi:hypothetical protein
MGNLGDVTLAKGADSAAAWTKCARAALGRQPGQQALDAALATATTGTGGGQPRHLFNPFRTAVVNRPANSRCCHLKTVTNQRVSRARLAKRHFKNRRHFKNDAIHWQKTSEAQAIFETESRLQAL